jgi:stage V sporulation protein SpoVS
MLAAKAEQDAMACASGLSLRPVFLEERDNDHASPHAIAAACAGVLSGRADDTFATSAADAVNSTIHTALASARAAVKRGAGDNLHLAAERERDFWADNTTAPDHAGILAAACILPVSVSPDSIVTGADGIGVPEPTQSLLEQIKTPLAAP